MSYFAVESDGHYWDHIMFKDSDGYIAFENYLDMTYDEMKGQTDIEDFVFAVINAVNGYKNEQVVITLIDEDDIFIWSVIMGVVDDQIRYALVDWKKNGENYRYEPS